MKSITKKLLSLLAVLTLALSLAVPAAAAQLPTDCPACGAKNVNWTALTSTDADVEAVNTSLHAYLPEDVTMAGVNALQTHNEKGATYCLYLNNHTMTVDGRVRLRSYATLNIFGDGKIVRNDSASTYTMFAFSAYTTLNIYGGTFENKDADHSMMQYQSTHQAVNIYGGTFINSARFVASSSIKMSITGGTFDVDPTMYVAEGYGATSADGVWTVAQSDGTTNPSTAPSTNPTTNPTTDPTTGTNPGADSGSVGAPAADNSSLARIIVPICIGAVVINVLTVLLTIHICKRKYKNQ